MAAVDFPAATTPPYLLQLAGASGAVDYAASFMTAREAGRFAATMRGFADAVRAAFARWRACAKRMHDVPLKAWWSALSADWPRRWSLEAANEVFDDCCTLDRIIIAVHSIVIKKRLSSSHLFNV